MSQEKRKQAYENVELTAEEQSRIREKDQPSDRESRVFMQTSHGMVGGAGVGAWGVCSIDECIEKERGQSQRAES